MSLKNLPYSTRLYCPGPTPIPMDIAKASMQPTVYHRTPEFQATLIECRKLLQPLIGSKKPPVLIASSGTGAMEAAVATFTAPGDKVVFVNGGKFGERWGEINKVYNNQLVEIKIPWGEAIQPELLAETLEKEKPDALFLQANETSTGVAVDLMKLMKEIRPSFQGIVCVDAISSLVAHPMKMSEWDIDIVVGGSQKGFGVPPGLSFAAFSEKAYARANRRDSYYFDIIREYEGQESGVSAWTPAVSLIFAMNEALKKIHEIGLEKLFELHRIAANSVREGARAAGLDLLAERDYSHALTSIRLPPSIDGNALKSHLQKKYGCLFAGGQGMLSGKILRFSHLGFFDLLDVVSGLSALEFALQDLGWEFSFGAATVTGMKTIQSLSASN